jgi:hypothetical protein
VPWVHCTERIISGLISFFLKIEAQPATAYDRSQRQADAALRGLPVEGRGGLQRENTFLVIAPGADQVAPPLHQFASEAFVREALSGDEEFWLVEDDFFRRLRFQEYQNLQGVTEPGPSLSARSRTDEERRDRRDKGEATKGLNPSPRASSTSAKDERSLATGLQGGEKVKPSTRSWRKPSSPPPRPRRRRPRPRALPGPREEARAALQPHEGRD